VTATIARSAIGILAFVGIGLGARLWLNSDRTNTPGKDNREGKVTAFVSAAILAAVIWFWN
jgi:hypothetical protein